MGQNPSLTEEELPNLTADDVEEVSISSSNVTIKTEDDLLRLPNFFRGEWHYIKLNGAKVDSSPGGTWQPFITMEKVEKFEYHKSQCGEEEIITINGKGEITP